MAADTNNNLQFPTQVLELLGETTLEFLANKYKKTNEEIRLLLAAGHEGLKGQFDQLVQIGLKIVARKALGI